MAVDNKKVFLKEISLWKKRFTESKRILRGAYKDARVEAKKVYKEAIK